MKVMIVEDESIVALDIARTLERSGHSIVAQTAFGEDVAELAARHSPDAVLMDVRLAGDVDGVESARRVHEMVDLPIVFLTAYSDEPTLERLRPLAAAVLVKPFDQRELPAALRVAVERHELLQRTRRRSRELAVTLQSIAEAVAVTDATGRVDYLNPAAEALSAWSTAEAAGQPLSRVFPLQHADGSPVEDPARSALEQQRTVTLPANVQLRRRDGTVVPVGDSASPLVDGPETYGTVVVLRDRTDEMRAADAQARQQRLAALGRLVATVAHEIASPLTYALINCEQVREELRDLAGSKVAVAAPAPAGEAGPAMPGPGIPREDPAYGTGPDSATDKGEAAVSAPAAAGEAGPAMPGPGIPRAGPAYGTGPDSATDKGEASESTSAEQLESWSQLLGDVHHGLEVISSVVQGMRSLGAIVPLPTEDVPLAPLVRRSTEMAVLDRRAQGEVQLALDPEARVVGNAERLGQLVRNLVVNALDACQHQGDAVRVEVSGPTAGRIELVVADTGSGIPPDVLARIFDPFFTTKSFNRGMGLGLAVVQRIVEEHEGQLHVESEPERGTRFVIRLPAAPANAEPTPMPPEARSVTGLRVLLVDDDERIRQAVERWLAVDHELVTVASADEAEREIDADPTFDVVICDVMMPERSGIELLDELGRRNPALVTRFAFFTGGSLDEGLQARLDALGRPVLHKPCTREEFQGFLAELSGSLDAKEG